MKRIIGTQRLLVALFLGVLIPNLALTEEPADQEPQKIEKKEKIKIELDLKDDSKSNVTFWNDVVVKPGEHYESVVVMAGSVDFAGHTEDLVVMGGTVTLRKEAMIQGDLVVIGGDLVREEGAQVKGEQVHVGLERFGKNFGKAGKLAHEVRDVVNSTVFQVGWRLALYLCLFAFGLVLLFCFPKFAIDSRELLAKNPVAAFGFGILGVLLFLPLVLALLVTIVGAYLIPLFCVLYFVLIFGGFILGAQQLARLLPIERFRTHDASALLVGVMAMGLLTMLPILGWTAMGIVTIAGFGAIGKTLIEKIFRKRSTPQDPVTSAPPAALLLLLLFTGALASNPALAAESEEVHNATFSAQEISSLEVKLGSGKVVLQGGEAAHFAVTAKRTAGNCLLKMIPTGDELKISTVRPRRFGECSYNLVIQTPSSFKVADLKIGSADMAIGNLHSKIKISSGSGDLKLYDLSGELNLNCGSGDITGNVDLSQTKLRTGSGTIKLNGKLGDFSLDSGSGDIELNLALPKVSQGRIAVGSADVKVAVANLQSGATANWTGHRNRVSLTDDQGGKLELSIRQGSGGVQIVKAP